MSRGGGCCGPGPGSISSGTSICRNFRFLRFGGGEGPDAGRTSTGLSIGFHGAAAAPDARQATRDVLAVGRAVQAEGRVVRLEGHLVDITEAGADQHALQVTDEVEEFKEHRVVIELSELQLPALFEVPSDIAARLVPIALYNLPLDYFATYSQKIAAVTSADLQRVARQYVRPEQMNIVIVGDLKLIEQSIRNLKMGKVELRDLLGRPIVQ